jgi:hypothetical protein
MVAVAQLVESRIVIPVVVGSSPISHPKEYVVKTKGYKLSLVTLFCFPAKYFHELAACNPAWSTHRANADGAAASKTR